MPLYRYDGQSPELPEEGRYWVAPNATLVGKVTLKTDASVWFGAVLRGDNERITIGARSNVQENSVMHTDMGFPLDIGEDVTIGHMAMLHGCTVGNRVLIGIGAVVLDGAVIEDEVVVAAGSLVPPGKTLESGYLYVGSPCKQARALSEKEKAFFSYSAGNYVSLKNEYLSE